MDIIARIKHKLTYLQQHEDGDVSEASHAREWQIKNHYPYKVHSPHTEAEITNFEAECSIRLPEDYRRFVIEIGSEVFPIEYAISPLDETDDRKQYLHTPFEFNRTMSYEDTDQLYAERGNRNYGGRLPILYTGCVCSYILIVVGEARGQIWHEDDLSFFAPVLLIDGQLFHHDASMGDNVESPPNSERVTFTQWYEILLNKQISIAQDHWQKRGRSVPPLGLDD